MINITQMRNLVI